MSLLDVVLIVLGVGYVLIRRVMGNLLEIKGLVLLPAVLIGIGVAQLHKVARTDAATLAFVVIGVAVSVILGLVRGTTVHLGERNGELWMRYRWTTVALWIANFAVRVALIPVQVALSAGRAEKAILLSVGLGLLAENAVVALRAMRSRSVVVWEKGKDGEPNRTSPAVEQARVWVRSASPVSLSKGVPRVERDW